MLCSRCAATGPIVASMELHVATRRQLFVLCPSCLIDAEALLGVSPLADLDDLTIALDTPATIAAA